MTWLGFSGLAGLSVEASTYVGAAKGGTSGRPGVLLREPIAAFAEVGVTSRDVNPGRRHPSAMVGAARAAGRLTTDYPAPGVTMPDS